MVLVTGIQDTLTSDFKTFLDRFRSYNPDGYVEKGELEIPDVRDPSWPHLSIADGRLYVREQDNLYVYDVRAGARSASAARD